VANDTHYIHHKMCKKCIVKPCCQEPCLKRQKVLQKEWVKLVGESNWLEKYQIQQLPKEIWMCKT